jgi:hypothetical protein
MRSLLHWHRWVSLVLAGSLIGVGAAAEFALAQTVEPPEGRLDENEVRHDIRTLQRDLRSRFRLFGQGDRATTGMRPTGQMEMFMTNTGIVDAADLNMDSQPNLSGCAACTGQGFNQYFDVSPLFAAPQSEWLRFRELVPSLYNATGGGWTVSRNGPSDGFREILASDNQFGVLFSGVSSTDDASCLDHSGEKDGSLSTGMTLLAGSNCPPTWPLSGGVPTWLGASPVSLDAYEQTQGVWASDFSFDWWRIDPTLIDRSKFFGNFQTYGAYDDFNSDMIGRFGNVVPTGSGDPDDQGWPLGIRTEFDAFTFALPTVSNSLVWRAIIINETEKVYGVGLDYEKLYLGYTFQPIRAQESSFYMEVWRGAILTAEGGTGNPNCPGVAPPNVGGIDCVGDPGFDRGATGAVVLKSPIGDLRNVLFTCSTGENAQRAAERAIPCSSDEFYDPGNVHAGDTITYNHFRMCPYGSMCSSETYFAGSDRQDFGAIASTVEDILNGRDIGDMSDGFQYGTFRNPNFPQQPTPHAFWVPGTWDYTANGTGAPDTLFVQTCYGAPGTGRENRSDACVVTWSDTMPVGELGNPAYNNQEGNCAWFSVGPFQLAAGDTTALVIATVAGPDSASFEAEVNNIIDLYMNFYLSPEAPPKVTVLGADVTVEDPALGRGRGEVTLFWDDASDDFVDPFLEDFADKLAAAAGGDLARIKALNPDLEDRIRERARDNLEEILLFKSCDGGSTFTINDQQEGVLDCDGDPATDVEGRQLGAGWQAYAVLPVDAAGDAPNSFVDELVTPGFSYLYVVGGQSRGATFAIVDSLDVDGDGFFDRIAPDSLVLAPSLMNPLATSTTEPNVVSVYVPATVQAGSQQNQAVVLPESDFALVDASEVRFTGADVVEARYRTIAGNQFEVVEVDVADERLSTQVVARDVVFATSDLMTAADVVIDSTALSTGNPNGVNMAGTYTSKTETVSPPDTTTTVWVMDGLGILLYRDDTGEPLIVSTFLDGEKTTPASFLNRRPVDDFIGFPGFVVTVDDTDAGDYESQTYELGVGGPAIATTVLPTVGWDDQNSVANQAGGISAFGRYDISWVGHTFGPSSPFQINRERPSETRDAFVASMEARAVGQVGRVDAEAAAAISSATGTTVTTDDLVAVEVPFTVANSSFERTVDVAMSRRPGSASRILLGNPGTGDTISVAVPDDTWVPGDRLFFIETVSLDSVADVGGSEAVVLDGSGQPIRVQRTVATFAPAVLSCRSAPRESCNPVVGLGVTGGGDWISNFEGQNLAVQYIAPVGLADQVAFDVEAAISGSDVIDAGGDISAQMDSIKVVPNPYVMYSRYQIATATQDDARLMFTHLPPEGTLRIFTVTGQFVQQITWGPEDLAGNGDLFWNMRTREGTDAASGLYLFVVEARNPATNQMLKKISKFVIIR